MSAKNEDKKARIKETARLMGQGWTTKQIAAQLDVHVSTVNDYKGQLRWPEKQARLQASQEARPDNHYSEVHLSDYQALAYEVEARTLVFDTENQTQVMWLKGLVPLPVGTEIELSSETKPYVGTATVKGTRLIAGNEKHPFTLSLECKVSDGWEKHYEVGDA